jgi:hypothetical protein
VSTDALSWAPAEQAVSPTASEPVAEIPAQMTEVAAPDRLEMDESSDLQTAAGAVADDDQAPRVTEIADNEPADTAASVAAHDEAPAPAHDEQSPERNDVTPGAGAPQPLINPDEDPGDLFEPAADPRLPSLAIAPAAIAAASNDDETARAAIPLAPPSAQAASTAAAANPPQPASASALRLPPVALPHAAPRPTASDPLAPIRALSAEELLALFS